MTVSSTSARPAPLHAPIQSAPPATAAPPAAVPAIRSTSADPDYSRVFAAATRAPDLSRMQPLASQGHVGTHALAPLTVRPSTDPITAQLDAVERRFAGPYRIEGQGTVLAPPMFHSNHPANPKLSGDRQLLAFATKACQGLPRGTLERCMVARPSPQELVAVTQALIDAGALAGITPVTPQAIRELQSRFCIGIDCIGYVRQAQAGIHGAEHFRPGTLGSSCMAQLTAAKLHEPRPGGLHGIVLARPGDVFHLAAARSTENREHNVVIRQHDTMNPGDPRWATLQSSPAGRQLGLAGGPVHLIEIVGAGGGTDMTVRGVRHELWLYNETTDRWGGIDPQTKELVLYTTGPQNHDKGSILTRRGAR